MTLGGAGNLAAVLEVRAAQEGWGPQPAFTVDSRTYTHDEVHDGAARASSLLAQVGVRPGEAVLLALCDGIEFAWAFLAAVRLGALAVPVNPQLTAEDHLLLARDCGAAAVVCEAELVGRFSNSAPSVTSESLAASVAVLDRHPALPVDASEPAYAQYTSGTTGGPKAAVHRHGDPLVYARAFARGAIGIGPHDVLLSVSKMYFAYGLGNSLFFPLLCGARSVLHPRRPRAEDIAQLVERQRVTVLFAVPTFYAALVRHGRAGSFASLRVAVSAGEHLTPTLAERAGALFGCLVLDGLGSTEVGQTFASNTPEAWRAGTVGRALPPYEVTVVDQAGGPVPAATAGRLLVRGPTVLVEYLGRPAETAAAMEDGWLRTGDLASLDGDGFLTHRGRADDIEMVGGISVAPLEIEEVLSSHPAVAEVAVAGVRDRDGASRLEAFVVPAAGVTPGEEVAADLVAEARSRLSPYKVPRCVHFVGALPRTPTGKLRRFMLRSGWVGEPAGR